VLTRKEWQHLRDTDLPQAFAACSEHPEDPVAVEKLLDRIVVCQDQNALVRAAKRFLPKFAKNPRLQELFGEAFAVFGMTGDAEAAYRRSLDLADTPGARTALAELLCRTLKPRDAEALLRTALERPNDETRETLYLLVRSYQARGLHVNAVRVLDRIAETTDNDQVNADNEHCRLRQISADADEGTAAMSAVLQPPVPSLEATGRLYALYPRVALPIVLFTLVVAYFGYSLGLGLTRPVYVVNGLACQYDVFIDGERVRVPGLGHVLTELREGELEIRPADGSPALAVVGCTIHTPLLTRPFLDRTFVINPDRTAVLVVEETEYSSDPDPTVENTFESHAGRLLYAFNDIEYVFERFPTNIDLPHKEARLKRQRLWQLTEYAPGDLLGLFPHDNAGQAETVGLLRRKATFEPEKTEYLNLVSALLPAAELLPLLRSKLDVRPVLVEWHRQYQMLAERIDPDHDLEAEYRQYLAAAPNDPGLLYLTGRILTSRADADELFRRAIETENPSPYAHHAIAFQSLCDGQFQRALEHSEKALEHASGALSSFQACRDEALWALQQYDQLLQQVRRKRVAEPTDPMAARQEVVLLLLLDRKHEAQQASDTFCQSFDAKQQDAANNWQRMFQALAHYLDGDLEAYAEIIADVGGDQGKLSAAICSGQLSNIAQTSAAHPLGTVADQLLLYLAQTAGGDDSAAAVYLGNAVAMLARGSAEERRVATVLAGTRQVDPVGFRRFAINPGYKRVILAALGTRLPEQRETYFELARRLNYQPLFPHRFLDRILAVPGTETKE